MIEIKDLLAKFDHLLLKEGFKIESIQEVLQEVLNLKVDKKDIKVKNNVIYLNIKPIYKNEIFIKQDEIYKLLERKIGKRAPKSIR